MEYVTIILPTYNEAENIQLLIERLQQVFFSLDRYHCAILVVDDNSPDGTAEKVRRLQKQYNNVFLLTGRKQGLGAAYVRGMKYAVERLGADIVFEMDADLSHTPKLIPQMLAKIAAGADVVIGSRYIPGGSIPANWAWQRKLFSIIGNLIIRFGLMVVQINDWSSGYRAIKKEVFQTVHNGLKQYTGYVFQAAFLHRAFQAGYVIVEIPLNFVDREKGKSKFPPLEYITDVLTYVLLNSSFIKFTIVGMIGFIINLLGLEIFYRLGLSPGIAAAAGAEFAIVANFFLNNFWSFAHRRIKLGAGLRRKFVHFNSVAVGAVLMQGIIVGVGTHFFGNATRFIFLVLAVTFFVVPYSYFMYNRFIWDSK